MTHTGAPPSGRVAIAIDCRLVKLTLGQALKLIQHRELTAPQRLLFLACGFQPLHLLTFLKAYYTTRFPNQAIEVQTGLYEDLEGTLATAAVSRALATVVVLEWSDLDSRLGLRSSGGWGPSAEHDILQNCRERLDRMLPVLETLASSMPVVLVAPTLPIPLLGHTPGWQMSSVELDLQALGAAFLGHAGRIRGVRVLHLACLADLSPSSARFDAALELATGHPYTIDHSSVLAGEVIRLLAPPDPMKGLITDLDETLWSGIVGEVGPQNVSWSLGQHAQVHGLYQQQLRQFSEMGVLLAIASKNESPVVEEALKRKDLYVPGDAFFPIRADWSPKSGAVREILRTWNIAADSVVFVDDSTMELDEVQSAFPSMTCLHFPAGSPAGVLSLLARLRDLFGRPVVQREDALRLASIRANAQRDEVASLSAGGEFIRGLQGTVTFDARKDRENRRTLELVNKTNQFNLNGVRVAEGDWLLHLDDPACLVLAVSYEDRFGPLGVISVVSGTQRADRLDVLTWVLSCRAFSRKIELQTLDYLFRLTGAGRIVLAFKSTERNEPLRKFLQELGLPVESGGDLVLTKDQFARAGLDLPHRVQSLGSE